MFRQFQAVAKLGGRRFYAAEAAAAATSKSGKLVLNLVAPHTALFESTEVERVDIPSTAGDMGILANHVPTIQQLRPGVIDVTLADGKSKKLFVSGGFAVVNVDNTLNINVLEAVTQDQVDKNALKISASNAQKVADKATSETDKALAAAELEVYQALEKFVGA